MFQQMLLVLSTIGALEKTKFWYWRGRERELVQLIMTTTFAWQHVCNTTKLITLTHQVYQCTNHTTGKICTSKLDYYTHGWYLPECRRIQTQLSYFPGIDWRLSWQVAQEVESNPTAAVNNEYTLQCQCNWDWIRQEQELFCLWLLCTP